MDELLAIEKNVGEIAGAIGLQFAYENETINPDEVDKEEFKEAPAGEKKKKKVDEDGNEVNEEEPEEGAPAEGGEEVPTVFKVEDHEWTITNRKPQNLP